MRYFMMVMMGILLLAGSAVAMERSVALPYQYGNGGSQGGAVFVPKCTASQYVGVSGTVFVCKSAVDLVPTCTNGQYIIVSGNSLSCQNFPKCANGTVLTTDATTGVLTCVANGLSGGGGMASCVSSGKTYTSGQSVATSSQTVCSSMGMTGFGTRTITSTCVNGNWVTTADSCYVDPNTYR